MKEMRKILHRVYSTECTSLSVSVQYTIECIPSSVFHQGELHRHRGVYSTETYSTERWTIFHRVYSSVLNQVYFNKVVHRVVHHIVHRVVHRVLHRVLPPCIPQCTPPCSRPCSQPCSSLCSPPCSPHVPSVSVYVLYRVLHGVFYRILHRILHCVLHRIPHCLLHRIVPEQPSQSNRLSEVSKGMQPS